MSNRDKTCEERISVRCEGRLSDFRDLISVANGWPYTDQEVIDAAERQDIPVEDNSPEESAQERMWELPLSIEKKIVWRVDLSTGGPADWLEVVCDDAGREVERIVYHFADWFDHAERPLTGKDYDTALTFISNIIPELY